MTISRSDVANTNLLQRGPFVGVRKRAFRGLLGTSSATILYTVPGVPAGIANPLGLTPGAEIMTLSIANLDTVPRTVTGWIVESGGAVADDRCFLPTLSIPANRVWRVAGPEYLEASETIRIISDLANKVNVRISVMEWTLL